MDERGVWLIAAQAVAPGRARASGQLGLSLRSVLLTPSAGFRSVFETDKRRAREGARPAEGIAPYVLSALGGASLVAFWLKAGSLFGVRQVAGDQFRWSYLIAAAVGGALISLLGQLLWGWTGAGAARALGSSAPARELRVVWGASAFPQVFALLLLIPLDLLIVGPATFTSERLQDPLSTGWAAMSIALSASLIAWSTFIFFRGIQVSSSLGVARSLAVVVVAAASLAGVTALGAVALGGA